MDASCVSSSDDETCGDGRSLVGRPFLAWIRTLDAEQKKKARRDFHKHKTKGRRYKKDANNRKA